MKNKPLVFESVYEAPVEEVWKALTDIDLIRQWSFDMKGFKPEPGCRFTFDGGKDDRVFHHVCIVKEVIPRKKLAYSWRYEGYEGDSLVSYELFPEKDKTRLKLTHEGLETFPVTDEGFFAEESFRQGWSHIIGVLLRDFVDRP